MFISPDAIPNAYMYSLTYFPKPEFKVNKAESGLLAVLFADWVLFANEVPFVVAVLLLIYFKLLF